MVPKRGQGLFILYFVVLNLVLSAIGYQYADPNIWYPDDKSRWMIMLISNRLGLLSFANLPLVFLYAGRNNFLLWVTDWSHSTFLLLHRWIAAIATLQAILHSLIYLGTYVRAGTYASESKLPYWYMGVIATLGMFILFPTAIGPIRRKAYEVFLVWHVIVSILVVAGCYWHIVFEFGHQWGYELWIIICMGIWAFDRVFRVLRLARHGIRIADITVIDDDYLRIDIAGLSTAGHAYLYFPTLTWRVWENHPFSIASTLTSQRLAAATLESLDKTDADLEKQPRLSLAECSRSTSENRKSRTRSVVASTTIYMRTHSGATAKLRSRTSIPVIMEAGYGHEAFASECTSSPTLIVLAGGVGITAVVSHLRTHLGRKKLYWGCRTQALVDDVLGIYDDFDGAETELFVGRKMNVAEILSTELSTAGTGQVCVLVSGPSGMVDDVRCAFTRMIKRSRKIDAKLVVESFSW
ncbi:hypothetical protein ANO11243_055790 [Dothideomycetidae sp. 11243]|nr:hypothetical protein ANO11243_055790 [fungal sp. No.11243]